MEIILLYLKSVTCIMHGMYVGTKYVLFEQETNNFSATLNDCLADIIICEKALILVFLSNGIKYINGLYLRNFRFTQG
jgi:hypothetical protein